MNLELPAPIAGYFAADRDGNVNAVVRHFTGGATVRDEGNTYIGHEAIRRWKAESSTRYTYTAQPIAIANEAGLLVVTAHLTGDFPGSPVDLRYRFSLESDRIGGLEIVA